MAKDDVVKGTTSKLFHVFIQDSVTGAPYTGLLYNTSSLVAYYYREGAGAAVAITLVTMTLGTWTSGGFIVVNATGHPGMYQLAVPDAALASGADSVIVTLSGASNMAPCNLEIALTGTNNRDATAGGISRIDAAISSRSTYAGGAVASVTAGVTVTTNSDKTGYALSSGGVQAIWDALTSALTTSSSIGKRIVDYLTGDIFARVGAPVGASISADVAAVKSVIGTPAGASVSADVAAVKSVIGTPAGASVSADVAAVKSVIGTPAGASVSADIVAVKAVLPSGTTAVGTSGGLPTVDSANSVKVQSPVKKNVALAKFGFMMYDTSGSPATGLTVTATRRIDGAGSATTCSNSVVELADGLYEIDLTSTELNGTVVVLRFTATGARDQVIQLLPMP